MVNVGMTIGLMPVIGIPLPFSVMAAHPYGIYNPFIYSDKLDSYRTFVLR